MTGWLLILLLSAFLVGCGVGGLFALLYVGWEVGE